MAKHLNGQVRSGIDIQGLKVSEKTNFEREQLQTLTVFFEERYKPHLLSHMKSGKDRAYLIKHYFVDQWGEKSLTDISDWLINSWRKQQLNRGLSHSGVNRPVSALKAMMNRAVEWGVIEQNPLTNVKALKEDPNPVARYLSDEEETQLFAALAKRQDKQREERANHNNWLLDRNQRQLPKRSNKFTDYLMPMVAVALNTGLRRGELFDLECSDIDLKNNQIAVRGEIAKSGKTRHIPLNKNVVDTLATWIRDTGLKGDELVFASPVTGRRFDNISKAWKALIGSAEIENFRFHDLRHTFASKLASRGANLYVIKDLLGHSSIETTQRYAHLAPEHKAQVVELLN